MRTFFTFLVLLCAIPSIAAAQAEYVVVPKRAKLYATNSPGSPSVSLDEDGYFTFLFVEKKGPRFRVRTVPNDPLVACYDEMTLAYDFELDFWVQSRDVMYVTTEPHEEKYSDGSFIRLKPGVVLHPQNSSSEWRADLGLQIPVTYDLASKTYVPRRIEQQHDYDTEYTAETLHLGPRSFSPAGVFVAKQHTGSFVDLETTCGVARLRAEKVTTGTSAGVGGMGMMGSTSTGIMPGATLYWTTGDIAGRYVGTYIKFVTPKDVSREIGTTYCFKFGGFVNAKLNPEIELCIDRDDLSNF